VESIELVALEELLTQLGQRVGPKGSVVARSDLVEGTEFGLAHHEFGQEAADIPDDPELRGARVGPDRRPHQAEQRGDPTQRGVGGLDGIAELELRVADRVDRVGELFGADSLQCDGNRLVRPDRVGFASDLGQKAMTRRGGDDLCTWLERRRHGQIVVVADQFGQLAVRVGVVGRLRRARRRP
jgi:hypothetical protein